MANELFHDREIPGKKSAHLFDQVVFKRDSRKQSKTTPRDSMSPGFKVLN